MRMLVSCISRAPFLPFLPFLPNFLSLSEKCTVPLALSSAAANAPLCLKVGGMAGEREGWKGGEGPTRAGGKRAAASRALGMHRARRRACRSRCHRPGRTVHCRVHRGGQCASRPAAPLAVEAGAGDAGDEQEEVRDERDAEDLLAAQ